MSLRWTLQFRGRQDPFEAGRHPAELGFTFGGGHTCMMRFGVKLVTNDFGKAFAKRWMPHAIEFSRGFEVVSFQSSFLRWVILLQICMLLTTI